MQTLTFTPMMIMPGVQELLIIFAIAVLIFGGKKLPQLMKGMGEGIWFFKRGLKHGEDAEAMLDEEPLTPDELRALRRERRNKRDALSE